MGRWLRILSFVVVLLASPHAHAEERRISRAVYVGIIIAATGHALSIMQAGRCGASSCDDARLMLLPLVGYPLYRELSSERPPPESDGSGCANSALGCSGFARVGDVLAWVPTALQWIGLVTALAGVSASFDRPAPPPKQSARWTAAPIVTPTAAGVGAFVSF